MASKAKRVAPDISVAACGYSKVLEIVSSKWTALAIHALQDGPVRYGDMRRRIAGVSQKMLTQTLRQLERDGLVCRDVTPSVPPSVSYSLTPLGETLIPTMLQLKRWAADHYPQVERARDAYDQVANQA
jgi:DNA-binding HxlR family transcriptional regulator